MKMIARTIEKWNEDKTQLKATLPNNPALWEEVSKFNGGLKPEQVCKAFDDGLSVWTSFSRYVPIREEVSDGQAAWETAMGMRGYAGSPAQQADRHEHAPVSDGFTDQRDEDQADQEYCDRAAGRV
jgi:hypothetical protein